MRLNAIFICLFFSIISCSQRKDISSILRNVEDIIEQYPDSALVILGEIDKAMCGREQYAQYSLLLSMALDKNYIDTSDFSILQPAIDYYLRKGSATEKLKTYYYMGRIWENNRNLENAMECYVGALEYTSESSDNLSKGRLFYAKGLIHNYLYEYEKCINSMLEAASCFKIAKRQSSYFNSLANAVNCCILTGDMDNAGSLLSELGQVLDTSNIRQSAKFYELKLIFLSNKGLCADSVIEECIVSLPEKNVPWLAFAGVFLDNKEYERGIEALKMARKHNMPKTARDYAISSRLFDGAGLYQEALSNYKEYVKLSDSVDLEIFRADTKFVEREHALLLNKEKEKNAKVIIFLTAVFVTLIFVIVTLWLREMIRTRDIEKSVIKNEVERYRLMCQSLEIEKEDLINMLEKNNVSDNNIRLAIESRLDIINGFFKAHVSGNADLDTCALKELEALFKNKKYFLDTTALIIENNHPGFIVYLKNKGLSTEEIQICCLYAIGLKGAYIGKYLETTNIYNISSGIRKKLGLDEYRSNLDKHIKALMSL